MEGSLSVSRVGCGFSCQKKHDYSYVQNIAPRMDATALQLGSLFHAGIAAYILAPLDKKSEATNAAIDKYRADYIAHENRCFIEEEMFLLDQTCDTARRLVHDAVEHFKVDSDWETVVLDGKPMVEFGGKIALDGWGGFIFYFDWVARDLKTGQVWLIDWKVRKQLQPVETEEVNLQSAGYQYALLKLGMNVQGTRTFQVSSSPPKEPSLNKNGTMSRTAIRTNWRTYQEALLRNGLDPNDYLDMVPKLEEVEFFRDSVAFRSVKETVAVWENVFKPAADQIRSWSEQGTVPVRNLNPRTCQGCQFRLLCLEELRGGDVEFIRKEHFVTKARRQDNEELTTVEEEE